MLWNVLCLTCTFSIARNEVFWLNRCRLPEGEAGKTWSCFCAKLKTLRRELKSPWSSKFEFFPNFRFCFTSKAGSGAGSP